MSVRSVFSAAGAGRRLHALVAILLFASAVIGGFVAFAQSATPEGLRPAISARYPDVEWVTTAQLATWLRGETPVLLLDARTPEEFDASHLANAVRVDPQDFDAEALPFPKEARVVVYCSVGWRSGAVADALLEAGYSDVSNLEGGIFAWANEGRPVVGPGGAADAEATERCVHPYDSHWGRLLRADRRCAQDP